MAKVFPRGFSIFFLIRRLGPSIYCVIPSSLVIIPKNIRIFIIPPKVFIFLKTPQNIEIQNFEPKKNGPSLRIYENNRVHTPGFQNKKLRVIKQDHKPNITHYLSERETLLFEACCLKGISEQKAMQDKRLEKL